MTNEIEIINNKAIDNILGKVNSLQVISNNDQKFLLENKKHLSLVLEKSHMWRTDLQKESIVSDQNCPTVSAKFHQAILEQKVQFDQSLYLAKDFEMKKIELEELILDREDILDNNDNNDGARRTELKLRKLDVDIQFKEYELQQMKTAMMYRIKEVKGWQAIINKYKVIFESENKTDDEIWNKSDGEVESMFFQTLTNLQGIKNSKDGGEVNNLLGLAIFMYNKVKEAGLLDSLRTRCNALQTDSLNMLESMTKKQA